MFTPNKLACMFPPCSTSFLDRPIRIQPVNKFLVCSFQIVHCPLHTSPSLDSILCLIYPYENHSHVRTILILSFHLFPRFQVAFFLSYPINILSCVSCLSPSHCSPFAFRPLSYDLSNNICTNHNAEAPPYTVFSTVPSLSSAWVELCLSASYILHLI